MMSWLYKKIGEYLKDAVYAANDGIITTFAVVAGVVGASLEPITILVLGFANLFADGISMASGNYLGTRSEIGLYKKEKARNERLFEEDREAYRGLVIKFLRQEGYDEVSSRELSNTIIRNKNFVLNFVISKEMGLMEQGESRPIRGAIITLVSFMGAGFVPLIPYVFLSNSGNSFLYASLFTALALFVVGATRRVFMERSWLSAGLEMLLIGGLAAITAYGVGFIIKQII